MIETATARPSRWNGRTLRAGRCGVVPLLATMLALSGVVIAGVGCAARHVPPAGGGPWEGGASWYGVEFHGRRAADGSRFNMYELTAAHRTLPFGTRLRVTNIQNGRSVVVTITDRGPFVDGRIIDLSFAAAQQIGMLDSGVTPVRLEAVS